MELFPLIVYTSPGAHPAPNGTYDWHCVYNHEGLVAAAKSGAYPTVTEAVKNVNSCDPYDWERHLIDLGYLSETLDRPDLEAQAKELGIRFNKNTKDEALLEKINTALDQDS